MDHPNSKKVSYVCVEQAWSKLQGPQTDRQNFLFISIDDQFLSAVTEILTETGLMFVTFKGSHSLNRVNADILAYSANTSKQSCHRLKLSRFGLLWTLTLYPWFLDKYPKLFYLEESEEHWCTLNHV